MRKLQSLLLLIMLFLAFPSIGYSQVEVIAKEAKLVKGADDLSKIGPYVFLRNSLGSIQYVPVGLIQVVTEAQNVTVLVKQWSSAGPEPIEVEQIKDEPTFYIIKSSGTFWVNVTAVGTRADGSLIFGVQEKKLVVGSAPTPGPTPPTPDPPQPVPDAPIDAPGMHILVVYESAEVDKMPAAQKSMLYSTNTRSYLNSVATDKWRVLDQHTNYTDPSNIWAKALKRPRTSLPWIIISNGTTGYEGPLPESFDALKGLITPLVPAKRTSMPLPQIIKYTTSNCQWCDKWDKEQKPYLPPCEYVEDTTGSGKTKYPSFTIKHNGKILHMDGYQTAMHIQDALRRLEIE